MATIALTNPCCLRWRKKYEDTVKKREALREAIKILQGQVDTRQLEISKLQQAGDEERARANALEEEKGKETSLRITLEKEIAKLKSQLSSNKPEVVSGSEDLAKELTLLRVCISERDVEIDHLKKLLAEEEKRSEAVREGAELEKKRIAELQDALEQEKSRADDAFKMADAMGKRVEEVRSQLQDALEHEKSRADKACKMADDIGKRAEETRSQLETLKSELEKTKLKCEEANRKLEVEKKKAMKERKRADEENARVMEQTRVAEANEKNFTEEKSHANILATQLEEEKQKVDKLQKELQEVRSSQRSADLLELDEVKRNLESEKKRAAREKKLADAEISKLEEQKKVIEANFKKTIEEKFHQADRLLQELQCSRQRTDSLEKELYDMNLMLEAEQKIASSEQKRAAAEKLKVEQQERISKDIEKRATEERCRADKLLQELENDRMKVQDLKNELHELKLCRNLGGASSIPPSSMNEQIAQVNLLQKQVKFEKQRVKHAKDVAKLEKGRNSILRQELQTLRRDFKCLLNHLDLLSDTFGGRYGAEHILKKSGLSNVRSGQFSRKKLESNPSDMYLCGDAELRLSSLSSRDASCPPKENKACVLEGQRIESPSGMETKLDLLVGGSCGKTLPSSALSSDTASFSDEQLVGSQEGITGSLSGSLLLAAENTNLQATIAKQSGDTCKGNDCEKVDVFTENSMRSTVEVVAGDTKKKRKILDEFESIKSMHSEGKRMFQEAEKKLSVLHTTLVQPIIEQMEKENLQVASSKDCDGDKCDRPSKKRKGSHEMEPSFLLLDDSIVQIGVDKLEVIAQTVTNGAENSQALEDASRDLVRCDKDAAVSFEQMINMDYMKILDFDDALEEENFRIAMASPLSPSLPEISMCESATPMDVPLLSNSGIEDQLGLTHEKNHLYCIVFPDMEEVSSISRIFCATRTCLAQCCLFVKKKWLVKDIFAALVLEKDLRPRDRACVLFSLILLNFSAVSSGKSEDFSNQEWADAFSVHIHSVLSDAKARVQFVEICDFSELVSLIEDFVLCRRVFLGHDVTSESRDCCGLSFEISDEGVKNAVSLSMASINLVMAGSTILASICKAVDHIGSICEVSFNILRMHGAEHSLVLRILHIFAYICGEEYFTTNSHCLVMKVVKSMVTFIEGVLGSNADNPQVGNYSLPHFPCVTCPFTEGTVSLEDVSSILLEELQNNCSSKDRELGHSSNTESLLGDVVSCLELIALKMGWDWALNQIIPKLFKLMESCDQEIILSTPFVAFLGELGRLGVEACGYNDTGVESIKHQLSDVLRAIATKHPSPLPMAVISALVVLYPKGYQELIKGNVELQSTSYSDIVRNSLSSLSSEQISCLCGLQNPITAV